jgi:hypothetical protein
MDWYRNLIIVLRQNKTEYIFTEPYLDDLPAGSTIADRRAHELMRSAAMMHSV